jgi:hypothetical protein
MTSVWKGQRKERRSPEKIQVDLQKQNKLEINKKEIAATGVSAQQCRGRFGRHRAGTLNRRTGVINRHAAPSDS